MHLSNGEIVYTNPYAADSDGDGLLDDEEIVQEFHHFGYDALAPFNPNNIYSTFNTHIVFTKRADLLDRDTDGDGLIDGEDPFPLAFNKYARYNREAAVEYARLYALYHYRYGEIIGTKGERFIKVVFDVAGKIWTAFPVKNI